MDTQPAHCITPTRALNGTPPKVVVDERLRHRCVGQASCRSEHLFSVPHHMEAVAATISPPPTHITTIATFLKNVQ